MDAVASNAVLGKMIPCDTNSSFSFQNQNVGLSAANPALGLQTALPLGATVNSGVVAGNFLNIHKKVPLLPTPGIVLPTTTATLQPPQIVSHPVLGSQGTTITVPIANAQNILTTTNVIANANNLWQAQKTVAIPAGKHFDFFNHEIFS